MKENLNSGITGQPTPTRACTGPADLGPCNFPELGGTPGDVLKGIQDIPLVIQDKTIVVSGAAGAGFGELAYALPPCVNCVANLQSGLPLFPPVSTCPADQCPNGQALPGQPGCGAWAPEFFGDTNVVNGRAFPFLQLWPGWFRLRLTSVSQARTYQLSFNLFNRCWKIGTEAGYVRFPQKLTNAGFPLYPAERVELLCDFTAVKVSWDGRAGARG